MDRLKQIIEQSLQQYTQKRAASNSPYQLLIDDEQANYALFELGFQNGAFYHITLFHLCIRKNKVWIYKDESKESLTNLLLQAGLQESEIVLAYFSPAYRKFTDFAIA